MKENSDLIPFQLNKIIDKGQEGLASYSRLLDSIESVLQRNNNLTEELKTYHDNIAQVQTKT